MSEEHQGLMLGDCFKNCWLLCVLMGAAKSNISYASYPYDQFLWVCQVSWSW